MSSKLNIVRIGKITIVCAFIALLLSQTTIAQFNKCKINGKTVYTDKACPDNTDESLDLSKSNFSTTPALAPSTIRIFNTATRSSSSSNFNSPGWLHDKSGYEKALKLSVTKGAPLFIYGYTDWCGYCKKLHRNMFQDASVKKVMDRFIKVKINPEHSAADEALFNQWGGRGYPTLFTQSASSSSPARTKGPFTRKNGKWELMSKRDFISMLRARL